MSDSNTTDPRKINVRLVSNQDAGENKVLEVTENMDVETFVKQFLSGSIDNLLIRVNGRQVAIDPALAKEGQPTLKTPLKDRDKVTVAPSKVEGARVR